MHDSTNTKLKSLKDLFQKKKILSIQDVLALLNTNSLRTAMRYLKKINYLSSYNHRGKYYTINEVPQFNDYGIWNYDSVRFSKHGNLKETLIYLVNNSEKGMTSNELRFITQCGVKDALLDLVKKKKIIRLKKEKKVYLYLNHVQAKSSKQLTVRDNKSIDMPINNPNDLYNHLSSEVNMSEIIGEDTLNDELKGIDLGDERLNKRANKLLGTMFHGMGYRLPAVFKGKLELDAAYRFFKNDLVTPDKILKSHVNSTLKRISQFPTVLLIQDTTDIDMKHMSSVKNLGHLNDTKRPGCSCHPLIAFTPQGLCLGIVSNEFMIRPDNELGKKKHNNLRKIEEKESYRWIKHYRTACSIAEKSPETKIIVVADREADIYELFLDAKDKVAHLVVRMWHDRKLLNKDEITNEQLMLITELSKAPIIDKIAFEVPAARGREKRKVEQNIRCGEFEFLPSKHKKHLPTVKINVVYLEEINPPKDEEPCNWIIGTTLSINSLGEVQQVIDVYLARWGIETFFKVLKSGCLIEKLQFQAAPSVLNCLILYMIISWRLLYITYLGRICPELPCTTIFEKDEWQSVYAVVNQCKPPIESMKLGAFVDLIATLGGYVKRNKMHPGPKLMWIGLQLMRGCAYGWAAAKKFASN